MEAIIKALEQIEKLIYKVLLWVVLLPKTLILIVLHPDEVPAYVRKELKEGQSKFDEYFSPVVLFLIVALVPFVIWNFMPTSGVQITSPSIENPTPNRTVDFYADADMVSRSTDGYVSVLWRVEQEVVNEGIYHYPVIRSARHTNNFNEAGLSEDFTYFYQVDNNTLEDFFTYTFPLSGGSYYVVATVYKADANDNIIESYDREVYVYVPENSQENVLVSETGSKKASTEKDFKTENIVAELQSERTIFMGLGIFLAPLTFALATKLFVRKKVREDAPNDVDPAAGTLVGAVVPANDSLNEDSLRDAFYIQCYYFSPIALLFWAAQYAKLFLTPDVFLYYGAGILLIYLPLILIGIWFVSVETALIAKERSIKGWQAFLLVLGCVAALGLGVLYIVNATVPDIQEGTRKAAIWLYPLFALFLLAIYHLLIGRRRRQENDRFGLFDKSWLIASFLIVAVTLAMVVFSGRDIGTGAEFDSDHKVYIQGSTDILTAIAEQHAAQQAQQQAQLPAEEQPQHTEVPAAVPATPTAQSAAVETVVPAATSVAETSVPEQSASPEPSGPDQSGGPVIPVTGADVLFTDEFDGNLDAWPYFMTQGDETAVQYYTDGGKLYFQLLQHEDMKPRIYFVHSEKTYTDVQIETVTTNSGVNANGVGLICRMNDAGWYEFLMSNSGLYTIYAVDAGNQFYYALATGGTPAINTGLAENKYTAVCEGNTLSLYINDQLVNSVTDDKFNFKEGLIGFTVYSPQGLPVNVDFGYIKVSTP